VICIVPDGIDLGWLRERMCICPDVTYEHEGRCKVCVFHCALRRRVYARAVLHSYKVLYCILQPYPGPCFVQKGPLRGRATVTVAAAGTAYRQSGHLTLLGGCIYSASCVWSKSVGHHACASSTCYKLMSTSNPALWTRLPVGVWCSGGRRRLQSWRPSGWMESSGVDQVQHW
jgi:hypothetical protein